ncbi:MAG TPA: ATPase [Acetobacteraceae bacterium]|jgi:uncharacterized protein|nr:ATPase [Acetobacteraceae bacterium]
MGTADILVGRGEREQLLHLPLANRHGLIAGATGTGKTITLQVLAEGFSRAGVPVFCADVKGDLAGISQPGAPNPKLAKRAAELGAVDYAYQAAPVVFWDLYGKKGHPIRATVAEMGPLLLSRMLDLNDAQSGVMAIAFALADDEGLLLLDFKDLRAILGHVGERAEGLGTVYGQVSKATVATIQRRLLTLEQDGGARIFGEPALALDDLMLTTPDGRGAVNVLVADALITSPRLYATFLLWLLSELFEHLPEVGDLDRPRLVFFFDEAHLLFDDAPRALVEKIEQVVRLIRSKGVGIYFVTQNPMDLPSTVLGQLGNRVQHALRAFTPADQKAVRVAATTFRANPRFSTETAISELAVGEALVSMLEADGVPGVVDRARICPPRSRMGGITDQERAEIVRTSPLAGKYDTEVDRESAYERLQGRTATPARDMEEAPAAEVQGGNPWGNMARPGVEPRAPARRPAPPQTPQTRQGGGGMLAQLLIGDGRRQGVAEALAKSVVRSVGGQVGTTIGRSLVRGLLGSLLKG